MPLQLYVTTIGISKPSNLWFVDTGPTHHMTHALDYFSNIKYLDNPIDVCLADNNIQLAQAIGDAVIQAPSGQQLTISNVYYVPTLQNSFVSISMLTSVGITILFNQNACELFGVSPQTPMACITCPKQGKLYPLGHTACAAAEEFPLPQLLPSLSSPPINHTQILQSSLSKVSLQPSPVLRPAHVVPQEFPTLPASKSFTLHAAPTIRPPPWPRCHNQPLKPQTFPLSSLFSQPINLYVGNKLTIVYPSILTFFSQPSF